MAPSLFEYSDYKAYVQDRIAQLPKKGRGEMGRLAAHLRMHPTRLSQIFKGGIDLTLEQACSLCEFFGLSALESDFFVALVGLARAGTKELRLMRERQLEALRASAKHLVKRVASDRQLSDQERATFYSSWMYSGVRLATSIAELQTVDALAAHFDLPRERVRKILDFLLEAGLCAEANGRIVMGAKATHLEATSPLVLRHHGNWRLKGIARHERMDETELAYTAPVSICHSDMVVIREMISQLVERFVEKARASDPPEMLACLNIDWFRVKT